MITKVLRGHGLFWGCAATIVRQPMYRGTVESIKSLRRSGTGLEQGSEPTLPPNCAWFLTVLSKPYCLTRVPLLNLVGFSRHTLPDREVGMNRRCICPVFALTGPVKETR
jgi:hypothetical protein